MTLPRLGLVQLGLALLVVVFQACTPEEGPPLRVEFYGCSSVFSRPSNPTCALSKNSTLKLWVKTATDAEVRVQLGDETLMPEPGESTEGGILYKSKTPSELSDVIVTASRGSGVSSWRLPLGFDEVGELKQRIRREVEHGENQLPIEEARQILGAFLAEAKTPLERANIISSMARAEWRAGQLEEAKKFFKLALEEHQMTGEQSMETLDTLWLFLTLFDGLEEVEAAFEVLEKLPEPAPGDAQSNYFTSYHRGSLAHQTGDVRGALRHLEDAARQAHRVGLVGLRNQAEQVLAWQLRSIGQDEKASEIFTRLERESQAFGNPCEEGRLLTNAAWDHLMASRAGRPSVDPRPSLQKARGLLVECRPLEQADFEVSNVEVNLALAELQAGNLKEAREHLVQAREQLAQPKLSLLLWWREIEARITLAEGDSMGAVELYRDLELLARSSSTPDAIWRTLLGKGRALAAAGEVEPALEALGAAESLLAEVSLRVPIDQGRETSFAVYEASTRFYLELLLQNERNAEALAVARRSRSRFFHGLAFEARKGDLTTEERARWVEIGMQYRKKQRDLEEFLDSSWQVPLNRKGQAQAEVVERQKDLDRLFDQMITLFDQSPRSQAAPLPTPQPDEVLLVYHPLPRGWVSLAQSAGDLQVHFSPQLNEIPSMTPEALAQELLEPFQAMIREARQVRILPYGALRGVDFHALPFADSVLVDHRPVLYALDLPPLPAPGNEARRALLVEDPSKSLQAVSGVEIPAIRQTLLDAPIPWQVETLAGHDATAEFLLDRMGSVDLWHFAGHADAVGHSQSSLELAAGSRLTRGEILTLPKVPGRVVLSACEGARTENDAAPAGLGVAQALLLAGSREVVGAVRTVDDDVAASLMAHFYTVWAGGKSTAEALRQAQLAVRREQPSADWASFRVIER